MTLNENTVLGMALNTVLGMALNENTVLGMTLNEIQYLEWL